MADPVFLTLSDIDKAEIGRRTLRAKESQYFEYTLMAPEIYGGEERLTALAKEIKVLQTTAKKLDKAADKEIEAAAKEREAEAAKPSEAQLASIKLMEEQAGAKHVPVPSDE